jgi:hypothetical protein
MRLGFFTAFGFSAPHRAAAFILLACFSQSVFAQVSDGKGLTSLEGVVPITDDRALWDAVKDSRDVAELQAYLAQFPKGLFATLAAIRIRALGGAGAATSQQATPQAPPIAQRQNIAPGQIIKDCADCPEMVVIPAGSFEMGSNESANEQPVHLVNVPGFLLGKTEVTQGQWKALMGNNPSRFSQCGDDCPVEQVSWNEAQEFALRLSRKTGKKYRLPSEAEWEYAARAGSSGTWSFGDDETQVGDHAWHNGNSQGKAQPPDGDRRERQVDPFIGTEMGEQRQHDTASHEQRQHDGDDVAAALPGIGQQGAQCWQGVGRNFLDHARRGFGITVLQELADQADDDGRQHEQPEHTEATEILAPQRQQDGRAR